MNNSFKLNKYDFSGVEVNDVRNNMSLSELEKRINHYQLNRIDGEKVQFMLVDDTIVAFQNFSYEAPKLITPLESQVKNYINSILSGYTESIQDYPNGQGLLLAAEPIRVLGKRVIGRMYVVVYKDFFDSTTWFDIKQPLEVLPEYILDNYFESGRWEKDIDNFNDYAYYLYNDGHDVMHAHEIELSENMTIDDYDFFLNFENNDERVQFDDRVVIDGNVISGLLPEDNILQIAEFIPHKERFNLSDSPDLYVLFRDTNMSAHRELTFDLEQEVPDELETVMLDNLNTIYGKFAQSGPVYIYPLEVDIEGFAAIVTIGVVIDYVKENESMTLNDIFSSLYSLQDQLIKAALDIAIKDHLEDK